MATSRSEIESVDLTTCPICIEQMVTPKYLPCLHSFCQTCIAAYFAAHSGAGNVECPVCRAELVVDEKEVSSDDRAKQLPTNFLIVELIDRSKFERKVKECTSCTRLGEKSEASNFCIECAELLCMMCTKYHRAHKASTTHKIKAISDVLKEELRSFQHVCPLHNGEILKLYCCDHEIECCAICVSVEHRKCETVKTIENAAKDVRKSTILKTVTESLNDSRNVLITLKDRYENDSKKLENDLQSSKREVEEIRNAIKSKIDIISDQLIAKLTQISIDSYNKYKLKLSELEGRITMMDNDLSQLHVALEKASDVQIMSKLRDVDKQCTPHKIFTSNEQNNYFHIHFGSNFETKDKLVSLMEGLFVCCSTENCTLSASCCELTPIKFSKLQTIQFFEKENEAVFTSNGDICVSKYFDEELALYNIKGDVMNVKHLDFEPHNIASDSYGYVAVVGSNGNLEIYSDDKLDFERKYVVSENAVGVALNEEYIAIKLESKNKIELYDRMKGELTKELEIMSELSDPSWYIKAASRGLYFSCEHTVQYHNKTGDIFFYSSELDNVAGIETDKKGNIYVADFNNDKIIQIAYDGSLSKIMLSSRNDIYRPRGLSFNKDRSCFLVVNDSGKSVVIFHVQVVEVVDGEKEEEEDEDDEEDEEDEDEDEDEENDDDDDE